MSPIPHPEVPSLLRQVVQIWSDLLVRAKAQGGLQALMTNGLLSAAAHPADAQPIPPHDKQNPLPLLERLLRTDSHLASTCVVAPRLAAALEAVGLDQWAQLPHSEPVNPIFLDNLTDGLVRTLFNEDYVRRAYFRFYNLELERSPLDLPALGASLETLSPFDIPFLTGESTATSTLHYPKTGDVFLVREDASDQEDAAWWHDGWVSATSLLRAFQYLKSVVIDADYSVLHFTPAWLNQVRRYGIHMWGRPRTDAQPLAYVLSQHDERTVAHYLSAMAKYEALLADLSTTLRQAIATAGDYYEGHHRRLRSEDKLIDLSVALEVLFSPSDKTELRFRISHSAALLLGTDPQHRKAIAALLRTAYDARSDLVHGGKSPFTMGKFSQEQLSQLADLVRQAILRLSVLHARGEKKRDLALARIEESMYDPDTLTQLRLSSDVDAFLDEQRL